MRVLLEDELFAAEHGLAVELTGLFMLIWRQPHRVMLYERNGPMFREWLQKRDPETREHIDFVLATSLEAEANEPPQELTIAIAAIAQIATDEQYPVFPFHEALQMLAMPLHILLENDLSDGHFLLSVARRDDVRSELRRAHQRRWLKFEQGGGITELTKKVKRREQSLADTLRTWVMFDSDGLSDGDVSSDATRAEEACESVERTYRWRRGSFFHRLERRAIENYIPPDSLVDWAKEQHRPFGGGRNHDTEKTLKRARAFARLSREQRWHWHMKEGLQKNPEVLTTTFGDIHDPEHHVLWCGFGDRIANRFYTEQGFRGRSPNADDDRLLAADDENDELQGMIRSLLRRL